MTDEQKFDEHTLAELTACSEKVTQGEWNKCPEHIRSMIDALPDLVKEVRRLQAEECVGHSNCINVQSSRLERDSSQARVRKLEEELDKAREEIARLRNRIYQLESLWVKHSTAPIIEGKSKEEAKDKFPPPSKCRRCGGEMVRGGEPGLGLGAHYYCIEDCGFGWYTNRGESSIPENGYG